jgi:hypothetical protein
MGIERMIERKNFTHITLVAKGVLDLECPHGPSIEETRFMSNSQ